MDSKRSESRTYNSGYKYVHATPHIHDSSPPCPFDTPFDTPLIASPFIMQSHTDKEILLVDSAEETQHLLFSTTTVDCINIRRVASRGVKCVHVAGGCLRGKYEDHAYLEAKSSCLESSLNSQRVLLLAMATSIDQYEDQMDLLFVCKWQTTGAECGRSFLSSEELTAHLGENHIGDGQSCRWGQCHFVSDDLVST